MYFIKNLIDKNEVIKAVNNPIKSGPKLKNRWLLKESIISTRAAIEIEGIPSKKEYLAESTLFHPSNRATEIVIPERETPGIMAKDWPTPIRKLFR